MELKKCFFKMLRNMFRKEIYWPTLLVSIILAVIFLVIATLFLVPFMTDFTQLNNAQLNNLTKIANSKQVVDVVNYLPFYGMLNMQVASTFEDLSQLSTSLLVVIGVLAIILVYFIFISVAFVIDKIKTTEHKTKTFFFQGFGSSFLTGLKLLLGYILFLIVVALVIAIIWLISQIPIIGYVIATILKILLGFYLSIVILTLIGKIATGASIHKSFWNAFVVPFKKPIFALFAIILLLGFVLSEYILFLLSLIPFVGGLLFFLGSVSIMIYYLTMGYYFGKETIK